MHRARHINIARAHSREKHYLSNPWLAMLLLFLAFLICGSTLLQ